jgi:RNAse (barnase) inhibitor barstar
MSTDQPSWATAEYMHMPVSTSEMFIYHPVDDVDAVWATVIVDNDYPLKLELFTPDDQELGLRVTGRRYDHTITLDEGSALDLDFANVAQRKAFFRMVLELADWIKEHHTNDL